MLDGPTQARPGPGSAAGSSVSGSATGLAPLARGVGGDLFHNFLDEPRGLDLFESGDGAAHASVTLVAFLTRVERHVDCCATARAMHGAADTSEPSEARRERSRCGRARLEVCVCDLIRYVERGKFSLTYKY